MLSQVTSPGVGVGIMLALVAFLMVKELTVPAESRLPRALQRAGNIGIVLLLVAFLLIMGLRIVEYLYLTA